jgi:hypothetical protein
MSWPSSMPWWVPTASRSGSSSFGNCHDFLIKQKASPHQVPILRQEQRFPVRPFRSKFVRQPNSFACVLTKTWGQVSQNEGDSCD